MQQALQLQVQRVQVRQQLGLLAVELQVLQEQQPLAQMEQVQQRHQR
jgi:hypothetical protein